MLAGDRQLRRQMPDIGSVVVEAEDLGFRCSFDVSVEMRHAVNRRLELADVMSIVESRGEDAATQPLRC